ncbi:MAG: DUF4350 domain-containing protein [Lentisphaerota bacterium]
MFKHRIITVCLLLPPLLLIGCGLAALFSLRLESGDIYPAYSSLRADPLGTRALYEGLGNLPNLALTRNFEPTEELKGSRGATLVFAGLESKWIPRYFYDEVSRLALEGARVVISFVSEGKERKSSWSSDKVDHAETNEVETVESGTTNKPDRVKAGYWMPVTNLWGAVFEYDHSTNRPSLAALNFATNDLPQPVTWHSELYFRPVDRRWRVLYGRDGLPVIMEKTLGQGSIVLVGDSYFLSNEAMMKERHTDLIVRLIGEASAVTFDESHLGIRNEAGVMVLFWKYRLYGFAMGLLLLVSLFLWFHLSPMLPLSAKVSGADHDVVIGMDSRAGYMNLLRRYIPPRDLMTVCFTEWEKSTDRKIKAGPIPQKIKSFLDAWQTGKHPDPVEAYKKITQIIKERGPS